MIVSVDEVKAHLRIDQDEEDVYLESLIRQAQAAAEDYCRVSFEDEVPEPVRLAILLFVAFTTRTAISPTARPTARCALPSKTCSIPTATQRRCSKNVQRESEVVTLAGL